MKPKNGVSQLAARKAWPSPAQPRFFTQRSASASLRRSFLKRQTENRQNYRFTFCGTVQVQEDGLLSRAQFEHEEGPTSRNKPSQFDDLQNCN